MAIHGLDRLAIHLAACSGGWGCKAWRGREGRTTCRVPVGSRFPVLVPPTPPPTGGGGGGTATWAPLLLGLVGSKQHEGALRDGKGAEWDWGKGMQRVG